MDTSDTIEQLNALLDPDGTPVVVEPSRNCTSGESVLRELIELDADSIAFTSCLVREMLDDSEKSPYTPLGATSSGVKRKTSAGSNAEEKKLRVNHRDHTDILM